MQPNAKTKKFPGQRHFLAVFFLSFMWGVFGVDRMYLGKWGTGIAKLVTLGGFGVWGIIDIFLIMSGAMRDKQGREMLEYARYRSFASKTVLIFAVSLGILVVINGVVVLATISQLIDGIQNGNIPGLDALQGLNGTQGLSPDQLKELGL